MAPDACILRVPNAGQHPPEWVIARRFVRCAQPKEVTTGAPVWITLAVMSFHFQRSTPEARPVTETNIDRALLTTIGVALVLVAPSVLTARLRLAHWRARFLEQESSLWIPVDRPHEMMAVAGLALLRLSDDLAR